MLLVRGIADTLLRLAVTVGLGYGLLYLTSLLVLPPCDCHRRPRAIEGAARACLGMLHSAQQTFLQQARLDRDGDGLGEAGTIEQLVAVVPSREPLLRPGTFARDENGLVHRGQYYLQLYLPMRDGGWTTDASQADPYHSERDYRACAWPDGSSELALHAFWTDASGVVWACANLDRRYSGATSPLGPLDGEPTSTLPTLTLPTSQPDRRTGRDQQVWERW